MECKCLKEGSLCCACSKQEPAVRLKNCRDEIHAVCQYCEKHNPTHTVVASRLIEVIAKELHGLREKHPEMIGYDEHLDDNGRPEVVVHYSKPFDLPKEINGIRIREALYIRAEGISVASITSFYGEHRFLSNFFMIPVTLDGVEYPSTEHAFQAAKTLDSKEREKVRKAPTCGKAKRMGRTVTLRADWDQIRLGIMKDLVRQKFSAKTYPDMAEKLLATGEAVLVEGNTWRDTFWGVCDGKGENHLGKILMEVREELRRKHA